MQVFALASIVLSAAAGASAMTLAHRDTLVARNDRPIARSSSADFTGHATFYAQNGLPGACGVVHFDSDLVAAISLTRYGPTYQTSPNCGRSITLTNTNNGKSVTVTVADACPTCAENDLDLTNGAFSQIASLVDGDVPIAWHYNN